MGDSGLRSSWPSIARNSSLARLAASSSSSSFSRSFCARSRTCRARTCSEISTAMTIIPYTLPSASRIGSMVELEVAILADAVLPSVEGEHELFGAERLAGAIDAIEDGR